MTGFTMGGYPDDVTQRMIDEAAPGYWDDDEGECEPEPDDLTEDAEWWACNTSEPLP